MNEGQLGKPLDVRGAFAFLVCLLTLPASALGQSPIGIDVLEFPMGVRNIGMGTTGVSDMSLYANGYYNPASVAWGNRTAVNIGYHDIFDGDEFFDLELSSRDVRAVLGRRLKPEKAGGLSLGGVLGYTNLNIEGTFRTIFEPQGIYAELTDYYVTGGAAAGWDNGTVFLSGGAAGKFLRVEYLTFEGDSWLLDFGMIAALQKDINGSFLRARAGVSMTNRDTGLTLEDSEYDIAGRLRAGGGIDWHMAPTDFAGRSVAPFGFSADVDFHNPDYADHFLAIGLELSILQLVQLRGGLHHFSEAYSDDGVQMLGGGIGWGSERWTLQADYARYMPDFEFGDSDFDRDSFGVTIAANF